MEGRAQFWTTHSVPYMRTNDHVHGQGPRINLTFRDLVVHKAKCQRSGKAKPLHEPEKSPEEWANTVFFKRLKELSNQSPREEQNKAVRSSLKNHEGFRHCWGMAVKPEFFGGKLKQGDSQKSTKPPSMRYTPCELCDDSQFGGGRWCIGADVKILREKGDFSIP